MAWPCALRRTVHGRLQDRSKVLALLQDSTHRLEKFWKLSCRKC